MKEERKADKPKKIPWRQAPFTATYYYNKVDSFLTYFKQIFHSPTAWIEDVQAPAGDVYPAHFTADSTLQT